MSSRIRRRQKKEYRKEVPLEFQGRKCTAYCVSKPLATIVPKVVTFLSASDYASSDDEPPVGPNVIWLTERCEPPDCETLPGVSDA